jgi:hypothetical protein
MPDHSLSNNLPDEIPLEEFEQLRRSSEGSQNLPDEIPVEEFEQVKASSEPAEPAEPSLLGTVAEQALSGATLGLSEVIETKTGLTTKEAIEKRREAHPTAATLANIAGGFALFNKTGGFAKLAGLTAESGLGAKLGVQALEGTAVGAFTSVTDDWSSDKAADAEKIVAHAKLGAVLGTLGGLIGHKLDQRALKKGLTGQPRNVPAPGEAIAPTTYQEIGQRVSEATEKGALTGRPQKEILLDALSRRPLTKYPAHAPQVEATAGGPPNDFYQITKDSPTQIGADLKTYESLQKYDELLPRIEKEIHDISPGHTPSTSAYEAGESAAKSFNETLLPLEEQVGKEIGRLKSTVINEVDHAPGIIAYLTKEIPAVASIAKIGEKGIEILPYDPNLELGKTAYNKIVEMLSSVKKKNPNLKEIFNLRKNLDDGIDLLQKGTSEAQLTNAKKAMMDYAQDLIKEVNPSEKVREFFAKYRNIQENIENIERELGAKIGTKEWLSLARRKPEESILKKIFKDSVTVKLAKEVLPPEKFNKILSDYINLNKEAATSIKGDFSSNNFSKFLRAKSPELNIAFENSPKIYQNLKDDSIIANLLPDAAPVVLGAGKTIFHHTKDLDLKNITLTGLVNKLPGKVINAIRNTSSKYQLNKALQNQAVKNAEDSYLRKSVKNINDTMEKDIKSLFSGSIGELGRSNERKR